MAGTGDVLGVATSGLLAYQRALATTGHNISNANTEGYSRQSVDFSARTPQGTGAGFIGTGVITDTVRRSYDEFLTAELHTTTTSAARAEVFYNQSSRVANLLGDSQAGLNNGMDSFFGALNDLSNDPTSIPARQVAFAEGDSLVNRFNYLNDQLDRTRAGMNSQLTNIVADINTLSEGIARLNQSIVVATGNAGGQPPNDLLDRRDVLLGKISEYVAVSTVEQDDGSINVFIGNGQSLVTGKEVSTLSVDFNEYDVSRLEIVYNTRTSGVVVTDNLTGGRVGGLLDFRREILDPAQNALGRIAVALSSEFNTQHSLGMDLDGNAGGNFFNDLSTSLAASSSGNTGDTELDVTVTDVSKLGVSDYRLNFDGSDYTLTRLSDNASFGPFAGLPIDLSGSEGFSISLNSGTTVNAGDSFLIQPTRKAARDISLEVVDARGIAAALPVRISEQTDITGLPLNAGNGRFSQVSPQDSASLPMTLGVTFTYDATLKQFDFSGDVTGSFAYDPATTPSTTQVVAGVQFTVTGTPADGDVFTLGNNTGGTGDNGNALLLGALQNKLVLENGTADLNGAYAQTVADVGTQTRQAELNLDAQQNLLRNAREARDSLSGVNLDEEAANLVRFQQAYQAMARVISVADTLFQTLLSAAGR